MASSKLNMANKCSDFGKGTSENLKNDKILPYLGNFKFSEAVVNKFDSKSSWSNLKIFFLNKFITKKYKRGHFTAFPNPEWKRAKFGWFGIWTWVGLPTRTVSYSHILIR